MRNSARFGRLTLRSALTSRDFSSRFTLAWACETAWPVSLANASKGMGPPAARARATRTSCGFNTRRFNDECPASRPWHSADPPETVAHKHWSKKAAIVGVMTRSSTPPASSFTSA